MKDKLRFNRRKNKHNTFESLFFILLVLIAGYVFLKSPLFDIQNIEVRDNQYLTEESVRAATDVTTGVNIFKVNLAEAAEQLEKVPMIKDARVVRALPATVVITVVERRPIGLLPLETSFVEVDQEGICLREASPATIGIPVITGLEVSFLSLGDVVQAANLDDALLMICSLPDEVVDNLSEVHVDPDGRIIAYTLDRIQCRLGGAVDTEEKGKVLARILNELQKQDAKVKYVDLTSVGKPVVRY